MYGGSVFRGGDHVQVRVHLGGAPAHVAEAEAWLRVVRVEGAAVVPDADDEDRAYPAGFEVHVVCAGVFGDVPERLDGHPVQGGDLGRVQRFEGGLEIVAGLDAEVLLEFAQALAEVVSGPRRALAAQGG